MCVFQNSPLEVEVFDHDSVGDDDRLGIVAIPLQNLLNGGANTAWYDLGEKVGKPLKGCGRIQIRVTCTPIQYSNWPPPAPPAPPPPPAAPSVDPTETLRKELKEARAACSDLEGELGETQEARVSLELEVEALRGDNHAFESKLKRVKEKGAAIQEELDRVRAQPAAVACTECEPAQHREAALREELERVKAELNRTKAERDSLQSQLKVSMGGNDHCSGELEAELEKSKSLLAMLRDARMKAARDRSTTLG